MSASDSDLEALRGQGGIPTSPFEIQITKDALQRRLDNGKCRSVGCGRRDATSRCGQVVVCACVCVCVCITKPSCTTIANTTGDITREDIEVLKRSYRWMTISSAVGWATGIPVFFLLKRRVPPPPALVRIGAATAVSMTGSFLGFAAGGAAAALEVNKNMPDANRYVCWLRLGCFEWAGTDTSQQAPGVPTDCHRLEARHFRAPRRHPDRRQAGAPG